MPTNGQGLSSRLTARQAFGAQIVAKLPRDKRRPPLGGKRFIVHADEKLTAFGTGIQFAPGSC
jgi:hypothetical protein